MIFEKSRGKDVKNQSSQNNILRADKQGNNRQIVDLDKSDEKDINKKETGLILISDTKFDKIRRKILMFFWGKDYEIVQKFEAMFQVNRPKHIVIPKEIKNKK